MRKKLFTFLLALAASVGMSYALTPLNDDTWDEDTKTLTVNSNPDVWAYMHTEIQHLVFSDAVTSIGGFAFYGCTALTSITIGNNVESIGARAFMHCSALTSITIPASVTSIGDGVFSNCSALQSIYIEAATPPTLGEAVFDNIPTSIPLYVPNGSVAAYTAAAPWNAFVITGYDPAPVVPTGVDVTANQDGTTGVYYATFYDSSKKYALPNDGTEAYAAEVSDNAMYLHKIAENDDVLPANTAVILKATSGSITLTESDETPVTVTATNNLHGVDADTEIATVVLGTCYVLSGGSEGVGFYRYQAPNQLKAHKAYIDLNGSGAAQAPKRLRFIFDNATGIDNTEANVKAEKLIENGQLVIIKNGVRYNAQGMIVK